MIPDFSDNMPENRREFRTVGAFVKVFKKEVKNFDETKLFFAKKGKYKIAVSFVSGGKLLVKDLHKGISDIRDWKGHFENFIETGIWDNYIYYRFYNTVEKEEKDKRPLEYSKKYISVPVYNKVYAIKAESIDSDHSKAQSDFMYKVRSEIGDCGMSIVGRPDNNDDVVFIN